MTPALMILGTHSGAGKSVLASAFCRILARRGYKVAPFKAQNMSNNAGVTPGGGEMGRAQLVQAEAAGVVAHTDMNPLLLKPERDGRSQVVLNGRVQGHIDASNWQELHQTLAREVCDAYDRLAARYDVVVMEGAGSPAEINLKDSDLVNLRMARHAQASCLLVGDIDRGGVFAALAGTLYLLEPEERAQIQGFLINKFRGDVSLLGDGLEDLRRRAYGVPTLGVIPFIPDLRLPEEDAATLGEHAQKVGERIRLDVAVVHLPHISNFDDFVPIEAEEGVGVRYVRRAEELGSPDVVILPGSKSTLNDLQWLAERGLTAKISAAAAGGSEIVGICGGFQMLGTTLRDPFGVESPPGAEACGLGLLSVETEFNRDKTTYQSQLRTLSGEELSGYEIHTGESQCREGATPFGTIVSRGGAAVQIADGARSENGKVWGTYLHGLFHNSDFLLRWLGSMGSMPATSDDSGPFSIEAEYDRLADVVETAVPWSSIRTVVGLD